MPRKRFIRFGTKHSATGGILSRMKQVLDRHSDFLEHVEGEDGIEIRRNALGGISIGGGSAGGTGSGTWSGIVWWLGSLKWDFSKVGADPGGDEAEGGLSESIAGVYLKVKLSDGSTDWADEIGTDSYIWNYYPVGRRFAVAGTDPVEYSYDLAPGRVVGDIRIDYTPHLAGEPL